MDPLLDHDAEIWVQTFLSGVATAETYGGLPSLIAIVPLFPLP